MLDQLTTALATLKAKLVNLHKSWTAWFNAVMAFTAFALPQLPVLLPQLAGYVPQFAYGGLLLVTLLGNLALRFKTSVPLEQK